MCCAKIIGGEAGVASNYSIHGIILIDWTL